ncbi:MAG: S-adenosyl-L-homocysteine hydrolase, partial [Paenibacillaceae bacterium]|nr:S-adenosyl-L-homocysteine hydrolase [Paenibacillaceae bacterium]
YVNDQYKEIGPSVVNVPYALDEQVARFKLDSLGIGIDRLSPQQEAYLASWTEH